MTDHEIDECLGALIEATGDAEASFHAAAGDVGSEEARALLLERAQRYGRAAASVRAAAAGRGRVRGIRTGPAPPRVGSADDAHILGDCERRECTVLVAFRDTLERNLPREVRAVLTREFETLLGSLGSLRAAGERAARQRRFVVGEPIWPYDDVKAARRV